jgi:hypothetical protein
MIRAIMFERYKKVLIAACILVIGVGVFNVLTENNQWKMIYHEPHAKENFEKNRDGITYWDEKTEKNVHYTSYHQFQKAQLEFYHSDSGGFETLEASNYSEKTFYYSNFSTYFNGALLLLVPLLGFLLFFIDQKTAFNHYLFSLGCTRKILFQSKILYVALPFLLATLISQFVYALLIHALIPAPYMNATLGQLVTSIISHSSLLFFLFCAGTFIGSMVGNVFFGPLTLFVFLFLRSWLPNAIYSLSDIINLVKGSSHSSLPRTLFVDSVGKNGGNMLVNCILVVIGLLLIFWTYQKFQSLSLENDNAYLLHKESRWPIWGMMTLFTSFVLIFNFFNPWMIFLTNRMSRIDTSISQPILSTVLVTLIVAGICGLILFFGEVTKHLAKTLNKFNHQMR